MRYHENRSRHNGVQAQPMPAAITGGYALRLTWAPGVSAQSCPSSATAVGRQSPVQQADPVPNFSRPLETPAAPMRPPQKRQSPSRWTGFGGEGWWPGALSNACISIKKCDRPMRACRAVTASVTAQKSDTKTIFEPPTWWPPKRPRPRFSRLVQFDGCWLCTTLRRASSRRYEMVSYASRRLQGIPTGPGRSAPNCSGES